MKFSEYQQLAARTEKELPLLNDRLYHALAGITSEAGEVAGTIKKFTVYNQPLNVENIKEEIGDALWYYALLSNAIGADMDKIAEYNIQKLRTRYPEKYSDEAAMLRADKPVGE